jgi:putative tryptophan/tyrosine transport system substrate-binding protein
VISRRTFPCSLTVGTLAAPRAAEGQGVAKLYRIRFLFYGACVPRQRSTLFGKGCESSGYKEGQNASVEYRFGSGQLERLPELATELARLQVDVIVTPSTPGAMAVKQTTSTIAIVFAVVAGLRGRGAYRQLRTTG